MKQPEAGPVSSKCAAILGISDATFWKRKEKRGGLSVSVLQACCTGVRELPPEVDCGRSLFRLQILREVCEKTLELARKRVLWDVAHSKSAALGGLAHRS